MDLGVSFAALGISLLELSEAGAVTAIYQGIYRGLRPTLYALAGTLLVLVPTFTVGRYIVYLPLDYVLAASAVILFYFSYRLLRSARRYFRRVGRGGEERGDLAVVFTVSAIEAFEVALVLIALIPRSYTSALMGTVIAAAIVIVLTALIKDQIARVRLFPPEVRTLIAPVQPGYPVGYGGYGADVTDLILTLSLAYLGINYVLIKV